MAQRDITQKDLDYVVMHGDWHINSGRQGGRNRTEVSLSRRLIPREDLASYGHLAGIVVVMDDYGKWLITTYKKRTLESDLRRPYARDRVPWQSHMEDGRPN